MLPPETLDLAFECQTAAAGERLLTRAAPLGWVTHVESGRVALGLLNDDRLENQLGVVEGPLWLEATAAILNLPSVVDAVAETTVVLGRVPLPVFRRWLGALPLAAQSVLNDMARAHRQQTELAVSRLAKDAEARCAEWLLRHAEPGDQGALAVLLRQRKRSVAAQLGISPETLSRVLRHLRERSLISGSGRVVHLVDPGGLRSLAGV